MSFALEIERAIEGRRRQRCHRSLITLLARADEVIE
jgi:hypothetical protein